MKTSRASLVLAPVMLILIPSETFAADLAALSPGRNEVRIEHDGHSRRLIVTTPETYRRDTSYPVLFVFHGAGGTADPMSDRWKPHVNQRGLILISAEAIRPLAKWNFKSNFHNREYDDVGLIAKVVETLVASKVADGKAVYATGHSSGGLFTYRLAKETDLFAAVSPMSCGMAKGAHDPQETTKPIPILQVIGDVDKSFNGSIEPKVTMYSAEERIEVWRTFNQCRPDPVVVEHGEELLVSTYTCPSGIEVALCEAKAQGHHLRRDLRDRADSIALDFLLRHRKR